MDQRQLPRSALENFKNFFREILATDFFFSGTAGLQSVMVLY